MLNSINHNYLCNNNNRSITQCFIKARRHMERIRLAILFYKKTKVITTGLGVALPFLDFNFFITGKSGSTASDVLDSLL